MDRENAPTFVSIIVLLIVISFGVTIGVMNSNKMTTEQRNACVEAGGSWSVTRDERSCTLPGQ